MQNFNDEIELYSNIKTTYQGKELILLNVYLYEGVVTMQYLPYGGIQSVFNYHLIINAKNGFITCDNVVYDGEMMSAKEFIFKFPHLVNQILPN